MDTRTSIRIFDENIEFIGEVDNYTSLLYTRKWHGINEFEFHVKDYDKTLYKKGNLIMINTDGIRSGVIKHIEYTEGDTRDVLIKGYGFTRWLLDRITYPPANRSYDTYNTKIEDIMIGLVNNNAVNPSNANRKIPKLTLATTQNRGSQITFQSRYEILVDELVKLSELSTLGFRIELDYANKQFIFKVVQGLDRSTEQNVNSYAIFSDKFDNLRNVEYTDSDVNYKNCAVVGGQGEGADRELAFIGDTYTGVNRREIFIDARDIDESSNLTDRGNEKLAEYQEVKSFECEVATSGYKVDWDLGDFVTIRCDDLGVTQKAQVLEVKEIYEKETKIEVTFGNYVTEFSKKLKQISSKDFENKEIYIGSNAPNAKYEGKVWIET